MLFKVPINLGVRTGTVFVIFFHANKDFSSDRSQNSLMHRWSTIQECLNTFAGCVSRIENRPQSGANAEDKVKINLFYMLLLVIIYLLTF